MLLVGCVPGSTSVVLTLYGMRVPQLEQNHTANRSDIPMLDAREQRLAGQPFELHFRGQQIGCVRAAAGLASARNPYFASRARCSTS